MRCSPPERLGDSRAGSDRQTDRQTDRQSGTGAYMTDLYGQLDIQTDGPTNGLT